MNDSISILLIEDDEALNRGISFKLAKEGFNILSSTSLAEGRRLFGQHSIDLILLDVGLPDGDGFQLCREIRQTASVPIIFLTACDSEVDVVMGYDLGADDYITKPFSLLILIAKINALVRRSSITAGFDKLVTGDLSFDPKTMRVLKNDREVSLTKTEMKLFRFFMDNSQQIITREQFLRELWDIEGDFIDENTLPVHIRRLREKIENDPSAPRYIKTVRGVGYSWAERCSRP